MQSDNQITNTKTVPGAFIPGEPAWFARLRAKAAAAFEAAAWPTLADEEWRRTDISRLPLDDIEDAVVGILNDGTRSAAAGAGAAPSSGEFAASLSYANGRASSTASAAASAAGSQSSTATLMDLAAFFAEPEAANEDSQLSKAVTKAWTAAFESADNKVALWALAKANHGAILYVPANAGVAQPFRLDFEYQGEDVANFPFVAVLVEAGAEASLEISWNATGGSLVNSALALVLGANSRVHLSQVQKSSTEAVVFSNTRCLLDRDAHLKHFEAILGGGLVKHRIDSSLMGPGSDLILNGISFTSGEQHIDLRTVQHHYAHHATSNTVYRGAVADESRSIYQGMIEVGKQATGTDAYLSNKNLVLHDGARADSIPCLQINTDDVRCSHGSTTGKIRADQIFFLMSRGFSRSEAQQELIFAYYDEVLSQEREGLQAEVAALLEPQIARIEAINEEVGRVG